MLSSFQLIRLNPDHIIKPFDCGDQDLNDFLFYEANKFKYFRESLKDQATCPMYFDLTLI